MENYEPLGTIGEGTYGVVLKARHKETGQIVAIKKFKESDEDEQAWEVRILKQLKHDNIVNLIEVFRRKGKLHLVFEFVERTILEDLERNPDGMDPIATKKCLWQLLRSIQYCHSHHVIHRDIKPENLLVSKNGTLKLCDFGFARTLGGPGARYTDYVATRWYRGPELLTGDTAYGTPVDVWAIGCMLPEMATGAPLFPGESDIDQLFHIMRCFGSLPERLMQTLAKRFRDWDEGSLSFLENCLRYEPEQRQTCAQLMRHPYFTEGDFIPSGPFGGMGIVGTGQPPSLLGLTAAYGLASAGVFELRAIRPPPCQGEGAGELKCGGGVCVCDLPLSLARLARVRPRSPFPQYWLLCTAL
ncbi:hypothetical protein EMIHUDRAFT_313453 [Emiliania huxleyi CCMP1516]|uniref:cyclin-dependent kinase n=2 Tax=Emiliania huxleyi TaxID=2903 RepID=A0A0D3KKH2_EMIH1|nr:hypothetical protein EMIHUDRAFT_313453 [Emiliania huxleyi CCMP1516]EOD36257.1 hypothetical protein EMIHUDRAFT_313453 [Emiliania huxleyi CCMP1516]|eukprot:XP_005788686.1 hypothetical protein EMIHUDRAFT_313453 [Emiliania huxleyi CCMP1516]